jgi:hypothetical protein
MNVKFKSRDYIRIASAKNFWFDFSQREVKKRIAEFNVDFSLIISRSDEFEEFYAIPFADIGATLLTLPVDDRGRWVGTIERHILKIHSARFKIDITDYFNRTEFLNAEDDLKQPPVAFSKEQGKSHSNLKIELKSLNEKFRNASPIRKLVLSEQVARPSRIVNALKELRDFTCQICRKKGFRKRSGDFYAEAHHLVELHKMLPNSYCTENVIILCSNCHRRIHLGEYKVKGIDANSFQFKFEGESWVTIDRNFI